MIVITTKKGKAGRPQISFSNQTTFSSPLKMPEFQTKYGNQPRTYSSWGGVLATPSSYNPQDFFNTAANTQTNASISVGNEKNQTYASLMHVYANGILPNNSYDKHSVTVRNTTSFLQDRMTLDAGFSYVETEDQNMLSAGRYFNPLTSLYTYPRGESVEDLMMFEIYDSNKKRYVQNWAWSRGALDMQNPLWMMHRNIQNNKRRRSMMNASLTYKVTDWLTLAGRAKADLSVGESSRKLYASTDPLFAGGDNGFFEFTKEEDTHRYGDFIATVNKHWEQFSLFANVGASISDQLSSIAGARGPLELPNFFSLTNTNPYGASGQRLQERKREQEQAVFASVEAGWRGMLYLTATVRNEWHSNPAYTNNLSYCFPSVGLSGLIHEMVKLPSFIDYLKWKQGSWSTSATRPIQNLRPKNTTSWEVGLNARLFANSLSLDFTYYKSNTKHQTFLVPLSGSAGYENMYAQTGNVENKGFELSIGYDKTWRDFAWSSSLTLSHNKNKVVELMNNYYDPQTDKYYTLKEYEVASMGGANFIMTEGGTMGDLYAYGDLWLDENGYIYINPNDPKLMVTDERIKLGSVLPDYNAGFRNDFARILQFFDHVIGLHQRRIDLLVFVSGPEFEAGRPLQQFADAFRLLDARQFHQYPSRIFKTLDIGLRHAELVDTVAKHVERVFDRAFGRRPEHFDHFGVRTVRGDLFAQFRRIENIAQPTAVRNLFVGFGKKRDIILRTVFLLFAGLHQRLVETGILAVVRKRPDHILDRDLQHDVHTAAQVETEVDLFLLALLVIELYEPEVVDSLRFDRIQIILLLDRVSGSVLGRLASAIAKNFSAPLFCIRSKVLYIFVFTDPLIFPAFGYDNRIWIAKLHIFLRNTTNGRFKPLIYPLVSYDSCASTRYGAARHARKHVSPRSQNGRETVFDLPAARFPPRYC